MKIRFWGTRGSIAKAGPGTVRYGGNTSCVELRSDSGTVVVLDGGTGAHGLGASLVRDPKASRRGHLLISHTHWDHIQGLPFFAPLFVPGNEWDVYGPQGIGRSLQDTLAGQMEYTYFPITPDQFDAQVGYHDLVEGTFDLGDIRVTARYLNHPALTLGYRLEVDGVTIVYATDHEPHAHRLAHGGVPAPDSDDELHGQFIADADLVIHDTQYTADEYADHTGWGHSTVEYATDLASRAAVRNLALFHHDPMRHDDQMDELVLRSRARAASINDRINIFAAAEGGEVELRRATKLPRRRIRTRESAFAVLDDRTLSVVLVSEPGPRTEVLTAAIEADGHSLRCFDSAAAATASIRQAPPALVLLPDDAATEELGALIGGLDRKTAIVMLTNDPGAEADTDLTVPHDGHHIRWLVWPFSEAYARTRVRSWGLRLECRWLAAAPPHDDDQRLSQLNALNLHREAEPRFDRYVRIARAALSAGSAMINIVDRDHQWTKACDEALIPPQDRDMSLCAHVLTRGEVLQIRDCARDPGYADHPTVRGYPWVRFYAGAPLTLSDGTVVGSLCIVDTRQRRLAEHEEAMLMDLARLVVAEMESAPA